MPIKVKEQISVFLSDKKSRILVLFLTIMGIYYFTMRSEPNNSATVDQEELVADTFIPSGYTLVPIELQNAEAISPLFDRFAIVDLYASPQPGQKLAHKIGSKLRLLRAPLQPEKFAVLVPEARAGQILSTLNPISAVVLPRNIREKESLAEQKEKKNSIIEYYSGGTK